GNSHPELALPLNNLAVVHEKKGEYADAEMLYLRALKIREGALGSDHSDVADSFSKLGVLARLQGHWLDAHEAFARATTILERHDKVVGNTLGNHEPLGLERGAYWNLAATSWHLAQERQVRKAELLTEAFAAVQTSKQTTTGMALAQMAARFASGQ